jgi:hypothetical protein
LALQLLPTPPPFPMANGSCSGPPSFSSPLPCSLPKSPASTSHGTDDARRDHRDIRCLLSSGRHVDLRLPHVHEAPVHHVRLQFRLRLEAPQALVAGEPVALSQSQEFLSFQCHGMAYGITKRKCQPKCMQCIFIAHTADDDTRAKGQSPSQMLEVQQSCLPC